MKTVLLRSIGHGLTLVLVAVLALIAAACQCGAASPSPSPALVEIDLAPILPGTITIGSTLQFMATGSYSNDSTADITSQVTWSSSDPSVAAISSTGLATAVGVGTAIIWASVGAVSSDEAPLTVEAEIPGPILTEIDLQPASPNNVAVGSTLQFAATATYSDGSSADLTNHVTWGSSDTSVATISSTGLVTGMHAGTTVITASLSGVTSPAVTLVVIGP